MLFCSMTAADLDEVLEIERRSFPEPWSRGLFLHELKVPFSRSILARADDEPHELLGYVCRWLVGDEIQILNIAVHPERRQHGIGRALVALVLQEAETQRTRTVTLEVRRGNTAALALYQSFGFTESGVRRHYYGRGEDAIIMSWTRHDDAASASAER
ncbi:MAG: ribosomal protein S18-alanine N-acetyltransferase [Candidatus Binatia bacterium]